LRQKSTNKRTNRKGFIALVAIYTFGDVNG